MSGKTEKKLRRIAKKEYYEKAIDLQQRAIDSWLYNLMTKPLKIRIKVAIAIIKGVKHGRLTEGK